MHWEYQIFDCKFLDPDDRRELEETLNFKGKDGWELISIVRDPDIVRNGEHVPGVYVNVVLKRQAETKTQ